MSKDYYLDVKVAEMLRNGRHGPWPHGVLCILETLNPPWSDRSTDLI